MDLREAIRQRNLGYENRVQNSRFVEEALSMPDPLWEHQPSYKSLIAHTERALRGPLYHSTIPIETMLFSAARTLPETTLVRDLLPTPDGVWVFSEGQFRSITVTQGTQGVSWYTSGAALYISPLFIFDRGLLPAGGCEWIFGESIDLSTAKIKNSASSKDLVKTLYSWFLTAMLFLRQRILETSAHTPDRAMRKWAKRLSLPESSGVRVVQLRRKSPDHHGPSEHPDWSCHWVVTGHWRAQYHPSTKTHEPRWILPYLKGDFDKPFKPPMETVFAVNR
jgi:hypothetical protein